MKELNIATSEAVITKTHASKAEETNTELVNTVVTYEPMANVGFSLHYTKNLGNYNSVKASVSLHMPSKMTPEELDTAFEFVSNWVDKKLNKVVQELIEETQ